MVNRGKLIPRGKVANVHRDGRSKNARGFGPTTSELVPSIISKLSESESFASVLGALDLALDVVSLAEERIPIVEDFLLVIWQVVPIGSAFFLFE